MTYWHETNISPVRPGDVLQPITRLFTGAPVNRAYVMNRSTGQIMEACGHRHRYSITAMRCAERMTAALGGAP